MSRLSSNWRRRPPRLGLRRRRNRCSAVQLQPPNRPAAPRREQSRRPLRPQRRLALVLVPPQADALLATAAGRMAGPAQAAVRSSLRRAATPRRERRAPALGLQTDVRVGQQATASVRIRIRVGVGEPALPLRAVQRAGRAGSAAIMSRDSFDGLRSWS